MCEVASRLETAGLPPIAFAAFHALAAPRWDYLCRLESENAECHVRLDEYTEYSLCLRLGRAVLAGRALVVSRWLMRIANWPTALLAAFSSRGERHNEIIDIERQFSRIVGCLGLGVGTAAPPSCARCGQRAAPWRLRGSRPKPPGILISFDKE